MEKIQILDLEYHKVFYVKTDRVRFYINVPKTVESTGLTLDLKNKMGNFDLENNDKNEVLSNIKSSYDYVDHYNITLVIPILDKELVDILEKIDKVKFNSIDMSLCETINASYKVLLEYNKKVSSQIIVINNERYKSFITWFTTKYKDRIENKSLLELIQIFNVNATSYMKMETSVMNFVVGSYNTEIDAPKIEKTVPKEEPKVNLVKPRQLQPASGFASYLILIIIAVIVIAGVFILAFVF